ncbi:MAG: DUF512 domain-containing protein [Bacillota bacterium]
MNSKQKYLILKTVQENNILPVTSKCNLHCKFCSHFQNPPELEVESYGHLNFDFIKKMIDFLPKEGPVILGESATKIIEGEPFYHPEIKEILKILRDSWPDKEIRITTNGSFLNKKMLKTIKDLENITLNISLNCSTPSEREYLMKDKNGKKVFYAIKSLNDYNINFNGSLVALPHVMGWESIKKTINYLDKYNAKTIRVFMPAYTDYSQENMKFEFDLYSKLNKFINQINQKLKTPVIFEPPYLKNLDAVIKGIISDSPAANTRLKKGNIIKKVNNEPVISRVDAFTKIKKYKNPVLEIKNSPKSEIKINKKKDQKSGLVMDYDLAPDIIDEIIKTIKKYRINEIIFLTSKMAKEMLEFLITNKLKSIFPKKEINIREVKNNFFGGSIITAGLLTLNDIENELNKNEFKKSENNLIILPSIMFDDYGKDLTGRNYKEISKKYEVEIEIL